MHTTEVTVRYAETDCMGVVHHATYPIWYEIARTDYIKAVGMSYAQMEQNGVMLPVTGITCKYRSPAHYDDNLLIHARITRLSPARIEFAYTVQRSGESEILAEGTSTHGFVDSQSFRPINLAGRMPELYELLKQAASADIG